NSQILFRLREVGGARSSGGLLGKMGSPNFIVLTTFGQAQPMSIEIEVKYRVSDHKGVSDRLSRLGGESVSSFVQTDTYYAHPARDFAQTDEALRLGSDDHGNRLTYKGPKWGGPTKTREEIEVPVAEGEEAR